MFGRYGGFGNRMCLVDGEGSVRKCFLWEGWGGDSLRHGNKICLVDREHLGSVK